MYYVFYKHYSGSDHKIVCRDVRCTYSCNSSILAEDSRIISRPWVLAQHDLSSFPPFLKLARDMEAPGLTTTNPVSWSTNAYSVCHLTSFPRGKMTTCDSIRYILGGIGTFGSHYYRFLHCTVSVLSFGRQKAWKRAVIFRVPRYRFDEHSI